MLYLIRHARTSPDYTSPTADWDLDPAGFPALERLVASRNWDAIPRWYASNEPKAVLTAQKLTMQPIVERPALRELERGTGLVSDYEDAIVRLFAFPDRPAMPVWETANQAQQRIVAAIDSILDETAHEDVAIVSHGLVISLWLAYIRGQERVDPDDWRSIGFPDYALVDGNRVIRSFQGR